MRSTTFRVGFLLVAFAYPSWTRGAIATSLGGPTIAMSDRPAGAAGWARVCSQRNPICVRSPAGTSSELQLDVLRAADGAWDTVTQVLHAPAPEGPLADPWEIYLSDEALGGSLTLGDMRDPQAHFDRLSTFALLDRNTPPGCRLDFLVARAVAEGSLRRAVPATDVATVRAQSQEIARIATPCFPVGEDEYAFQAAPSRCLFDARFEAYDRGASLFYDWLETSFSSAPGSLVIGSWSLAPTITDPRAWRWATAPTTFDVLRASLHGAFGRGTSFDDVWMNFGVARASMAPPPALAWSLPWPKLARRIMPSEPVEPTGVAYVRVELQSAPPGSKLRLEAQWEDFARMRWIVLKRDLADRTLAELHVTSIDQRPTASLTVEELQGVDHLLILVENLGTTEHAFNPDQQEWESHGWLLTLEPQQELNP